VKQFSISMIAASMLVIAPVHADVSLQLGDGVNLHALNGEAWSGQGVLDSRSPITLENGTHQIVVDLTAELGRSRDDSVIESSDSFVLLFQASDRQLVLSAPGVESRSELEDFNNEPVWQLNDQEGNSVSFRMDVLKKTGFQLVRDYEEEVADFNRDGTSEAALMPHQNNRESFSVSPRSMPASDVAEDQEVVGQMLRYWYLKADDKTKSEMKRWINSGE